MVVRRLIILATLSFAVASLGSFTASRTGRRTSRVSPHHARHTVESRRRAGADCHRRRNRTHRCNPRRNPGEVTDEPQPSQPGFPLAGRLLGITNSHEAIRQELRKGRLGLSLRLSAG